MKLVVHNRMGQPQILEVTRLVVYDRLENPVMVAVDAEGAILASTVDHADFNALLEGLGIKKFVVCLSGQERPLEGVHFEPVG